MNLTKHKVKVAPEVPAEAPFVPLKEPSYSIEPARYAKDMTAVSCPSNTGLKSRAARLACYLKGKYSGREKAYIMSATKANKLKQLYADGWDADFFGEELEPPKH